MNLRTIQIFRDFLAFPTTLNTFIFRHVIRDATATDCVDSGIGFFHGEAVEDYAYAGIGHAIRATFGGHAIKIRRSADRKTIEEADRK